MKTTYTIIDGQTGKKDEFHSWLAYYGVEIEHKNSGYRVALEVFDGIPTVLVYSKDSDEPIHNIKLG